jgi:hypothetical protein
LACRRPACTPVRHSSGYRHRSRHLHTGSNSRRRHWRSHCPRKKPRHRLGCTLTWRRKRHPARRSHCRLSRRRRRHYCMPLRRNSRCPERIDRPGSDNSSARHPRRCRSMRRPRGQKPDCIRPSGRILPRSVNRRLYCWCNGLRRSKDRRSSQRCSRRPCMSHPRFGNNSAGHRHCQHIWSPRRPGCIARTKCTVRPEPARPWALSQWRCRHTCHSRKRGSRNIEYPPCMRRRCSGNSCAHRLPVSRCWRRQPNHRPDCTDSSTCTRSRYHVPRRRPLPHRSR